MLKKLSMLLICGVIAFTAFSVQATAASCTTTEYWNYTTPSNNDYVYWNGSRMIKSSSTTSSEVKFIQAALNWISVDDGLGGERIAVDSKFGPGTKTKVVQFQTRAKELGIYSGEVDGSVGKLTLEAMHAVLGDGVVTFSIAEKNYPTPIVGAGYNAISDCEKKAEESKIMDLVFPTSTTKITGRYGPNGSPRDGGKRFHSGIDIGAPKGADVYAVADGTVVMNGWSNARGNYVVLYHEKYNISTIYEHLDSYNVKKGATVNAGDVIATVGNSGFYYSGNTKKYYAVHLHFGIIRGLMQTLSDDLWYVGGENNTLDPDPSYCENIIKYSYK